MSESPPRVRIVTLGCPKNDVDSEEIAGVLSGSGATIDASSKDVDVVIINTCGFLESAKEESIRAIKDAVRERKAGRVKRVIVAGCLSQRMGAEIERLAPGADRYVGVGQMARFSAIVEATLAERKVIVESEAPHHRWADIGSRARTGKPWSAYLKVSEGCDHKCTFCTIPSFRGAHVSKPIERVVEEARALAQTGAKELNLIAQDVTQYGFDLYKAFTLPKLLRELNAVDGIEWIRILYFYPNRLTDEVIEAMSTLPKVCEYIDIPLQHAHPDVLRRMKRPWDGDRYLKLFEKVRAAMPNVAIRSTFIVGYPGESTSEFDYLVDFMQEARLDRVGAFRFSREPGTPSFDEPNQISAKVKNERYDKLMRIQQNLSLERNRAWIGKPIRALIDEVRDGWSIGRTHRDAPDIDGLLFAEGETPPGTFVEATVTSAEPYDLFAATSAHAGRRMTTLRMAPVADPK